MPFLLSHLSNLLINHEVLSWTLAHRDWVTDICVNNLNIIGSDNGLSPGRCQAIIWTNAVILLMSPLGTNFSEVLTEMYIFSFTKVHLKMSSGKWRPFCLGLNVITSDLLEEWNTDGLCSIGLRHEDWYCSFDYIFYHSYSSISSWA